jgi:hypothetical protein
MSSPCKELNLTPHRRLYFPALIPDLCLALSDKGK